MPALPTFKRIRFRGREIGAPISENRTSAALEEDNSERTLTPTRYTPVVDVKRATRTRKRATLVSSFCFSITVIFLILVSIGNTSNRPVLRNTFFFKLDLSNVFAQALPTGDVALTNSIARSLGLHDFYQVGLWSYCEGYNDEGITFCSRPDTLYWFDPVSIILNELLPGATISLPISVVSILHIVKMASNAMYLCFLLGTALSFLSIFLVPLVLYSRWYSLPLSILTFFAALLTAAAAVIATAMFTIFKRVFTSQAGLQIGAELGVQMMVFMWVATAGAIAAWVVQVGLGCCCASRRDVRTGRRRGSRYAYGEGIVGVEKKKKETGMSMSMASISGGRLFGRNKAAEEV